MTRILVATTSTTDFSFLSQTLTREAGFTLLPRVRDLMETFSAVEDHMPRVVLIDRSLTRRAEFELMRALFETHDVRWLVWNQRRRGARTHGAQQGADLFVLDADMSPKDLRNQVKAVARSRRAAVDTAAPPSQKVGRSNDRLILIGASTGGVDALISVLSVFPADCPPTVIVQHTGAAFGASLANLLDLRCTPKVHHLSDDRMLAAGQVHVAAGGGRHAVLTGASPVKAILHDAIPLNGHRPSVDAMFQSAVPLARRCVACILTGMGRDGAEGLLALRRAGATTVAQDAATSVVYGMPRAAVEVGAAQHQLPLDQIGKALLRAANAQLQRQ